MARRASPTHIGLGLIFFVFSAAIGVLTFLVYTAPAAPLSLEKPLAIDQYPVRSAQFSDPHTVSIIVARGPDVTVTVPIPGTITHLSCSVNSPMQSGRTSLSINGKPLLNLATKVPLWRDLKVGDQGEDVEALQMELARLGYPVARTGRLQQTSVDALTKLYAQIGGAVASSGVSLTHLLWLPNKTSITSECPVSIGTTVGAGEPIAKIPGRLESVAVAAVPAKLVAGQRTLEVGGIGVEIDPRAPITNDAKLAELGEAQETSTPQQEAGLEVKGQLRLSSPAEVRVVPPSSVRGSSEDKTCVFLRGREFPVSVVSSELGQTYVVFQDSPPAEVDVQPPNDASCG